MPSAVINTSEFMYYGNPSGDNFLHDTYGSLLEFGCISSLLLNLIGRCCTFDFFSCVCCPSLPLHREIGNSCQDVTHGLSDILLQVE